MSYPFLAVRLGKLGFDAFQIGVIIGVPYFFSGIAGVFAGNISDQWGQKKTMIASLLIGGIAFFYFASATGMGQCLFLNIFILLSSALFEPAASSLISTVAPKEMLSVAFRYRYVAINLGASVGPMLGGVIAYYGNTSSFQITGILFFFYAGALLFLKVPRLESSKSYSMQHIKEALGHMKENHAFLYLTAANFLVSMTYCQMLSTLPQILTPLFPDAIRFYSILLSLNPAVVIITSLLFTRILSEQSAQKLFRLGGAFLCIAFLGFGFIPPSYFSYTFFMIIFTLGEIVLMPTSSKFLVDLAPPRFQGSYLGSESSYHLGFFSGNLIGGKLLQKGYGVFFFCLFSALVGMELYRRSWRAFAKVQAKIQQ